MIRHSYKYLVLFIVLVVLGASNSCPAQDSSHAIDIQRSSITVYVYKSGLFSMFAHNHTIHAPIREGKVSATAVELVVESGKMTVIDTDVSDQDRAKIQGTMLGPEVLDSKRYPEIRFRSNSMKELSPGKWKVEGELTLHGETKSVTIEVTGDGSKYTGTARLRQTDFGITPISLAGGTIKVKDEVEVEFEVQKSK